MGSIVLIKLEGDSKSEVVDGQQRLTTLSMMFCTLRDLAEDSAADELDGFVHEAGNSRRGTQDRFRLMLRERDRMFFQKNVQSRGAIPQFVERGPTQLSDSRLRMFENTKLLAKKIGELSQAKT